MNEELNFDSLIYRVNCKVCGKLMAASDSPIPEEYLKLMDVPCSECSPLLKVFEK